MTDTGTSGAADKGPANLDNWNKNAEFWDSNLGDGNDMFQQLILPTIEELAELKPFQRVLDLGTGNGIVARRLATRSEGVKVIATDYSEAQLARALDRTRKCNAADRISFAKLNLLDEEDLDTFAEKFKECVFP